MLPKLLLILEIFIVIVTSSIKTEPLFYSALCSGSPETLISSQVLLTFFFFFDMTILVIIYIFATHESVHDKFMFLSLFLCTPGSSMCIADLISMKAHDS